MTRDLKAIKKLWSQKAAEDFEERQLYNWMNHPFIDKYYINEKVSGRPEANWVEYLKEKYIPNKLALGLTLGCGSGALERHALSIDICEAFEAFDIAEGAIEVARLEAQKIGLQQRVEYDVCDLNSIQLEAGRYDIVFGCSSVHHFKELEHIFSQVKQALKPEGFFVMNEFIGPSQFQWTAHQISLANQILAILPNKYKERYSAPNHFKEYVEKPTIEFMNAFDPSEAIRSAEIIPILSQHFHIVERIDYGGTILHELLNDIAGNFNPNIEEDRVILKMLCFIEETLIQNEVIPSDFTFLVAQNKAA